MTRREKQLIAARKYYQANRETLKAKMRKAYTEIKWSQHLTKKYGINAEQYFMLLANQLGSCAICQRTAPGGSGQRFHVDHDHATGKVRGLLCTYCNRAIGLLQDSAAVVRSAEEYLTKHGNSDSIAAQAF